MRISDWSSDVCSSDLPPGHVARMAAQMRHGIGEARPVHVETQPMLPRQIAQRRDLVGPIGQPIFGRLGDADRFCGHLRSEEHTSELQSLMRISYAVFCLKKKRLDRTTSPYFIGSLEQREC